MNKRILVIMSVGLSVLLSACSTTRSERQANPASERTSINASVDTAMTKLYAQSPGSAELVRKARGVLVFPDVVTAGFVVGGSYGKGALRVNGRTERYYSMTAGSVGLLAGADSKAFYILFMSDEALAKFRASNGWTVGADASVSFLKSGADAGVDTQTVQRPIVGYVLTNAGLMANISVDGTKISPLSL